MEKKKTFVIVIIVIIVIAGLLGILLYKPVRSTIVCNQLLSIPPSFVYTKSGFRNCMSQKGVSNFFIETYIQIRDSVERNKEGVEYMKDYYRDN